ncbi:MAG: hypothetical protein LBO75_03415, partial [Bifidobacteriaceae bacterium]|jgi:hypothetical protein|nr:hypothetical protein [Bifidobacteriaceae bacterium]
LPSPTVAAPCAVADLERDLERVIALSWRVAETGVDDAVPTAIARAATVDLVVARDGSLDTAGPEVADLATLAPKTLTSLALAEDQAAFLGDYWAAGQPAETELRLQLEQVAQLHRKRAEALVAMSSEPDPRAVAYELPPPTTSIEATRTAWGEVELRLATHYGALPLGSAAEPFLSWQLVQAHTWGVAVPALPFIDSIPA